MLLAGILLKLGGVGIWRVICVVGVINPVLRDFLVVMSLVGGLLCSCFCLCQCDLKAIIAYSSIGHMAFCFGGILSGNWVGIRGAICMMFAHGICSPMLFAFAG